MDNQPCDLLDHIEYEDSENNCSKYVYLQDVPGKGHDNHGTYDWLVELDDEQLPDDPMRDRLH